jgi:outer membrane lipoprotein carrier protein
MKKWFLFFIMLAFGTNTINAQNTATAEGVLDKAASKVQSSKGINVSFSLTQKDKAAHVLSTSKGVLKIKGEKFYLKQEGTEIFCNGIQVWNYDGDDEVTLAKADNDEDAFSPQQILTGFNKKDFNIKLVSSSGANYQLQLVPVDKRKNFKQITLYINKSTNLVSKATITDKLNAVTEIIFTNVTLNVAIPDNQFVFDPSKHPGVEIVNQ